MPAREVPETARQEIDIPLGGKTYKVRPTFEVIANLEISMQVSARALGRRVMAAGLTEAERQAARVQEVSLSELATAVFHILRDQEGAPENIAQVGAILMDHGTEELIWPVGTFLVRSQRGHIEHEKEVREAAEKAERERQEAAALEAGKNPPQTAPPPPPEQLEH